MNDDCTIGPGSRVTLHFSLSLEDGSVVDSNFEGAPPSFTVGDGSLLPGFERALFGLRAGDRQCFKVPPEDAFGQPNPNNLQEVARDQFSPDMELEPGLVVSFADAAGGELPGVISEVDEGRVVVDFNHPLAGRTLSFEVAVHRVEPAEQA